jgi:hypothetical protein
VELLLPSHLFGYSKRSNALNMEVQIKCFNMAAHNAAHPPLEDQDQEQAIGTSQN